MHGVSDTQPEFLWLSGHTTPTVAAPPRDGDNEGVAGVEMGRDIPCPTD